MHHEEHVDIGRGVEQSSGPTRARRQHVAQTFGPGHEVRRLLFQTLHRTSQSLRVVEGAFGIDDGHLTGPEVMGERGHGCHLRSAVPPGPVDEVDAHPTPDDVERRAPRELLLYDVVDVVVAAVGQ